MVQDSIAVILAAGEGTRMKSDLPKVLHQAAGAAMGQWVIDAAVGATGRKPILVYGSGKNALPEYFGEQCTYAKQEQRLGSGHAVMAAAQAVRESGCGYSLIIAGDMPLIRKETLEKLLDLAQAGGYACLLLSAVLENPEGYGRIVRQENGAVLRIVEQKDATEEEKKIREVNASIYCFENSALLAALEELRPNNAQGEYYLTDCVEILNRKGKSVGAMVVADAAECSGVNDKIQLAQASKILRRRLAEEQMREGAIMIDPDSVYLDKEVTIGKDSVIYPGVILEGKTTIGSGCTIYQGSRIVDSQIEDGASVQNSVVLQSKIGEGAQVGPYAYLRPGTEIGKQCRIGDFVEVKNSRIDDRSKVSHLTYVGDGRVGKDVNIGCGVVFVNYDGNKKCTTEVGDGAFIGCNTNLISPVKVGKGAYIAAGATVTKDIPEDALCIARAKEVVKAGWAKGRYTIKKK